MSYNTSAFWGRFFSTAARRAVSARKKAPDLLIDGEMQKARLSANSTNYYVSAFAAKAAVFKALPLDWEQEVDFREIAVSRGQQGEPVAHLRGDIKARAEEKGCRRVLLSLSYETDLAVAMAFVEGS